MNFRKLLDIKAFWLPAIIILIGVLLRLNVYLQNRSLIIDEANLARNLVERDYADLFSPLIYEQYAPPLFLAISKLSTQVFGVNEYALKLFPFIAGIISLLLFYLIIEKIKLNGPAKWYMLILFIFSILAIRYATEFKQYSVDLLCSLLFIWGLLHLKKKELNTYRLTAVGLVGALAIWLSMPMVYLLSAVGLILIIKQWRKPFSAKFNLIIPFGLWLLSFTIYYFQILQHDIGNEALQRFHSQHFLHLLPFTKADWQDNFNILTGLFTMITDKTTLSIIWAFICLGIGALYVFKSNKYIAIIALVPIFLCLFASGLGLYSLVPRLSLFMLPLFLLLLGFGVNKLWQFSNPILKFVLLSLMLITVVNKKGYEYFWKKMEFEDSKSLMSYLENNKSPGEFIYVYHDGVPAFIFYNEMHDQASQFDNYYLASWSDKPAIIISEKLGSDRDIFWLFFSHTFPDEQIIQIKRKLTNFTTEIESFKSQQASLYKFKFD